MKLWSLVGTLLGLVLQLASGGCVALYDYHPVEVTVVDAETMTAVSGADVKVAYNFFLLANPPKAASAVTDVLGRATLRTATYESQRWSATAVGFLPHVETRDGRQRPKGSLTLRLYRAPAPRVVIVLPAGYRGPVGIEMQESPDWVQGVRGQREFSFGINSAGYVRIDATPLLLRVWPMELFHFVYEDGIPVVEEGFRVGADEVALRWVTSSRLRELYVIGTADDMRAIKMRADEQVSNRDSEIVGDSRPSGIDRIFDMMR